MENQIPENKIEQIALSKIKPLTASREVNMDTKDFKDLRESILLNGIINDIIVGKDIENEGEYFIIKGKRRFLCLNDIDRNEKISVRVFHKATTEKEYTEMMLRLAHIEISNHKI